MKEKEKPLAPAVAQVVAKPVARPVVTAKVVAVSAPAPIAPAEAPVPKPVKTTPAIRRAQPSAKSPLSKGLLVAMGVVTGFVILGGDYVLFWSPFARPQVPRVEPSADGSDHSRAARFSPQSASS